MAGREYSHKICKGICRISAGNGPNILLFLASLQIAHKFTGHKIALDSVHVSAVNSTHCAACTKFYKFHSTKQDTEYRQCWYVSRYNKDKVGTHNSCKQCKFSDHGEG